MKSAVLMLLLVPSAFSQTVARFSGLPASVVAPIQLQTGSMPGLIAPSLLSGPALSMTPSALRAEGLSVINVAPAIAVAPAPVTPTALAAVMPAAAKPTIPAERPVAAAQALQAPALALAPMLSAAAADGSDAPLRFDGALNSQTGAQLVDPRFGSYRRLAWNEQAKLDATVRYGSNGSQVFQSLNGEFQSQGGYYLLDSNPNARYLSAAAVDSNNRPVIILTHDLLNRYNGRSEDEYRGAPWEFIAAMIAREQVFYNNWYGVIPASAEKLAISYMNMTRVFVDLTNGTSRSWATDKDYAAVAGTRTDYTQWNWFEQLVAAARSAAQGAGTNTGHLIESKFFSWVRDYKASEDKSAVPAFQYSLWEQLDGRYYRPGDSKNGQPLPAGAPRIDKAAYDRAAGTAYGADGKGNGANGALDQNTAYGWIIKWLKDRFEF
jgi:hypothetical protein